MRIKETESIPPSGFGAVAKTRTRVRELKKDEPVPPGAVETTEPVQDWTLDSPENK